MNLARHDAGLMMAEIKKPRSMGVVIGHRGRKINEQLCAESSIGAEFWTHIRPLLPQG